MRIHLSEGLNPWGVEVFVADTVKNHPHLLNVYHSPTVTQVDRSKEAGCVNEQFQPLFTIDRADPGLQQLMDELWQLGIRPRDIGTAGHLAATQAHLGDMKALVEKAFNVQFKP